MLVLPRSTGRRRSRCIPLIEVGIVLFVVRTVCILHIVLVRFLVDLPFLDFSGVVSITVVVARRRAIDGRGRICPDPIEQLAGWRCEARRRMNEVLVREMLDVRCGVSRTLGRGCTDASAHDASSAWRDKHRRSV